MSLTRKFLKGMNLTDEQVESIIELHLETVNGLKTDIDKYKADAEKLPAVQKELDALKTEGGGYKEKYEKVKKEFDDYKSDVSAKETKTAKEKAVRAYYESKNITGKSLDIAMRGSAAEIDAVELENGKIKDASALDELISGTFAGLVSKTTVTGAKTDTPPSNGGSARLTKEDIYKKDDKGRYVMTASERQKALIENQIT